MQFTEKQYKAAIKKLMKENKELQELGFDPKKGPDQMKADVLDLAKSALKTLDEFTFALQILSSKSSDHSFMDTYSRETSGIQSSLKKVINKVRKDLR